MTDLRLWSLVCLLAVTGCVESAETPSVDAAIRVDGAVVADLGRTPEAGVDGSAADSSVAPTDAGPDSAVDLGLADAFIAPDVWVPPDAFIEPDVGPDAGPPACDPPLAPDVALSFARIFDLVTVHTVGGGGDPRYEFADNQSGALLNAVTGAYLAGERVGVEDRIRITDTTCVGEAFATVRVVEPMVVRPERLSVTPNAAFVFEHEGGSDEVIFELLRRGSGPELSEDGRYAAGPVVGQDSVRVTDVRTGQIVDVFIDVTERVELVARPPVLYLPVGASHPLRLEGGSGHYEAVFDDEGAVLEANRIRGVSPGRSVATITDRFTGQQVRLTVNTVSALPFPSERIGDGSNGSQVLAPGDLDGDGFDDVIVASPEADYAAVNSGAVYIYRGGPDGVETTPAQILAGTNRRDEFGRGVALGDFDDDGEIDLAVGVWLNDTAGGDSGSVFIYRGLPGGLFEPVPDQTLNGIRGGDQLGWSVAACDFNGDGRLDLAVTALRHEDREAGPSAVNQGAIFTFLRYEDGFIQRPDTITLGLVPDGEGGFMPVRELKVGWWLAAADFDGDGRCDLAAHSLDYMAAPGGIGNDDGTVFIYRGEGPDELGNGGLSALPYAIFAGIEEDQRNRQFGRRIAAADFDGDGRAELVAGQYRRITELGPDVGAALIMSVGDLAAPALEIQSSAEAIWTVTGDGRYDNFGWHVGVTDSNADGVPDLVVGAWADERPGAPGDSGAVFIFEGQEGQMPSMEPSLALAGVNRSDRMGESAAFVGDVNADGFGDVVGFSARTDLYGAEVGAPYVYLGRAPEAPVDPADPPVDPPVDPEEPVEPILPVALEWPAEAAGSRFGRGVNILGDVDGDGVEDVITGAMFQGHPRLGVRAGAAYLYSGGQGEPTRIEEYPLHSGYDLTGVEVGPAGDFDGDGNQDFAIVAQNEERPTNLDGYGLAGACGARVGDTGAVFIFRGGFGQDIVPDFIYFGQRRSQLLQTYAGDVDINGDGLSDFIVGSVNTDLDGVNDVGSATVVFGRPVDPDNPVTIICEPDYRFLGLSVSDHAGRSVTAIGDLNGDGCDEVAFGTSRETLGGLTRQGAVRVLFGWGGIGCPANPSFVTLTTGEAIAENGWSVAAGDLNGDGIPEIVSGGPLHLSQGIRPGGVWIADGRYVASLPRSQGAQPDGSAGQRYAPEGQMAQVLSGAVNGERFGLGLAIVNGVLAIGGPSGAYSGTPLVGSVQFYRGGPDGVDPEPIALFTGETYRPGGRLGEFIKAGTIGGRARLIIGGYDASGGGLDNGAAYLLDIGDL